MYYGANWREEIKLSKAGKKYVDRIREISANQPELLIGHSYTRYLGDLSGGQILKTISQRAMNLNGSDGVAFYEFPTIEDEKAFKNEYRESLGEAPVDDAIANAIVEEANDAFGINMELFQELEGNLIKAVGVMLFNSLTGGRRRGSTELATEG